MGEVLEALTRAQDRQTQAGEEPTGGSLVRRQGGAQRCQSFARLCVRGTPGRAMKDGVHDGLQDGLGAAHCAHLTVGSPCLPGMRAALRHIQVSIVSCVCVISAGISDFLFLFNLEMLGVETKDAGLKEHAWCNFCAKPGGHTENERESKRARELESAG